MQLSTLLSDVKGVGPKTWEQFTMAGLQTVEDLIYFFPRDYEDYAVLTAISDIKPGNVTLQGKISNVGTKRVRRGLSVTEATLGDKTGKVSLVWFNQPYRAKQLDEKNTWLVSGEFAFSRNKYQILNPSTWLSSEVIEQGSTIIPIYRQLSGLKSTTVRVTLKEIRPFITMLSETLPTEVINREKLISYADAILRLHFPETNKDVVSARERLGFEEILEVLYGAALNKKDNARLKSWHIPFTKSDAQKFTSVLPFKLTDAQRIAAWEIIQNFSTGEPMNRLLQGDVGSGKTVVAAMAAYVASRSGFQSAIMAPTELLARQHVITLSTLLEPLGVSVGLLVGSVKGKARKLLYDQIKAGSVAVVVGTHALIQEAVEFHKLGFVVIDEQHRFGVKQRQKLLEKSEHMPHLLSMTATPIPRSLQLTVYGELDISLLAERPVGRKPILTEIHSPNSRAQLYAEVEKEINAGRQVYVVCPLISPADTDGLKSVEAESVILKRSAFKYRSIGLLHGKLDTQQKQTVMESFSLGNIDILVSTTVVEVGVDVPNASVMIIEGAERFGLAQLHQLRGRVGRSSNQSYCYLIPSSSAKPSRRLLEWCVPMMDFI